MNEHFVRHLCALLAGCLLLITGGCARTPPGTFDTPEQAVQALAELIGSHDRERVEEIFGPGSVDLFQSGDPDADEADFARVKEMIHEKVAFEDLDADTKIALLGAKEWPWPIPLVQSEGRWRYDTEAGREELLNRRIGRNELWTLTALRELVDAQREYAAEPRDGNPPSFAQRFRSSPGRHDGLYWHVEEGEPESPLGDLLAESDVSDTKEGAPNPFHGYFYRMLSSQGPSAPGGEQSYVDAQGLMTGGFAAIAWPAKYGNSGVMTFLINHRGIVFQKDLGPDTETLAANIRAYDPDVSWEPTADAIDDAGSDDDASDESVD